LKTFTLKAGYILSGEEKVDSLHLEVITCINSFYCGILTSMKENAFQIPCGADCGNDVCENNLKCNLVEYEFQTMADLTPDNLMRAFAALTRFEPVICVQTINPNDPTDLNYWNRFNQDETVDETVEASKTVEQKNLN